MRTALLTTAPTFGEDITRRLPDKVGRNPAAAPYGPLTVAEPFAVGVDVEDSAASGDRDSFRVAEGQRATVRALIGWRQVNAVVFALRHVVYSPRWITVEQPKQLEQGPCPIAGPAGCIVGRDDCTGLRPVSPP